ncbi:MAG: serine--tRNA ligase [Clostridia bacterium]
MLDIKLIKTEKELVKKAMQKRNKDVDIDALLEIEEEKRALIYQNETMKAEQNKVSKQIPQMKKDGGDTTEIFAKMKELSEKIKQNDLIITELTTKITNEVLALPNILQDDVPYGKDSDDNVEVRKFSEPTKFDFEPKPHWELGKDLDILDPETAAKVTGARFHFYKGLGARLERAVINFYLNTHTERGYKEILPPFIVNRDSMTGTGQLPKFEEDAFKLANMDYFLIPTAEVPVTNMYRDDIIEARKLPICYCAYSACFRAEAGSAGRDTRGLIRQHQFNKVELVKFTRPEESAEELEKLTADAEHVLQLLKLPYRVVLLCSGDTGFSSSKTYDIEVYMPSYGRYVEISSCSNFRDFQARRAKIRFKDGVTDKAQLVHTLNGSGVAIGRTVAAILENYQNADGSITVPDVLIPYMGTDVIRGN